MRFGLLGALAVWADDGSIVAVPERKVRMLLADLLVHLGQPLSADRLIDHLWGNKPPATAANTVQRKISQLRNVLDTAEPGGRNLLTFEPAGYILRIEPSALDVHQFSGLVSRARAAADPGVRAQLLGEALKLWRGPALADFRDEPFTMAAVARLDEERVLALEDHVEARLVIGEHATLTAELSESIEHHPLRERLRAAHMRSLYQAGRQTDALAAYQSFREHLADELGIDPSPELEALHQAILERRPDPQAPQSSPAPSAKPRTRARTNLPLPLTELIGRAGAVTEVCAQLRAHRLVTLTGPGGVGKTRLAVASTDALAGGADHPPDGIWLVELAALTTAAPGRPETTMDDIAEVIASTLDLRDGPAIPRLTDALRDAQVLLILDNCEHVIEAVAETVHHLLSSAPHVRVLATSREPLGVAGEVVWAVPPLDLPSAVVSDPDLLQEYSAAALFAARAAAVAPGFVIDETNAAAVRAVCRRLDGIPLALELAASRVPALGVHELARKLDDRFRLLTAGKRGVPARQRTLRGVIDWSWNLLGDDERTVLRRLAVHADGCTLAAAEHICGGGDVDEADVAAILGRLVDRSLVVASACMEPRYGLLESVSAYSRERLVEAGEADVIRRRHRRYYTQLAEQAARHLRGPDQRSWLWKLDAESANVRRALDGAVHAADADTSLRIVNALAWYWFLRGRRHEAIRSLNRALELNSAGTPEHDVAAARARGWRAGLTMIDHVRRAEPNEAVLKLYEDIDDPAGRASTVWLLGHAEFAYGNLAASEQLADDALAGFRALGERWGMAACLALKANHAVFRNDLTAMRQQGEDSLDAFTRVGDGWGRLQALEVLGTHAEISGQYERAADLLREAHTIAEDLKLWTELSWMMSRRGRISLLTGDLAEADQLHEQGLQVAVEHADRPGQEFAVIGLALGARRKGRLDDAERLLRPWLDWNRDVEADYGAALILAQLGFVAELRGDADAARSLHTEGLAAALSTGDVRAVALALEGLAGAETLAGRSPLAARLLGAADTARASVGAPLPEGERHDVERITARAVAALGPELFAAEFGRGAQVNPAELTGDDAASMRGTLSHAEFLTILFPDSGSRF
ncbi:AfsR/SARP family transcriptional regulator [Phytoactinopolyspora alkaliphila]|uniref:AfsR/SARP family transcriptional regulator n=1 Tax=Phytoactinopolyspora alkaliphila TaxID=1783498 RepID=A0A6N9YGE8_9ACTN|nr:BTAD domain-containing putative transcriptional regulator [Phytoactinopolyspora alkaliphila]NED94073.1 AfsR/SARP family transcriptional regulator [Phytoactinopolyspora alkaliphila]